MTFLDILKFVALGCFAVFCTVFAIIFTVRALAYDPIPIQVRASRLANCEIGMIEKIGNGDMEYIDFYSIRALCAHREES